MEADQIVVLVGISYILFLIAIAAYNHFLDERK